MIFPRRICFGLLMVLWMVGVCSDRGAATEIHVNATGSSLVAPLLQQYFYSWLVLRPVAHFDYESTSSSVGVNSLLSGDRGGIIWAGTELVPTPEQYAEAEQNGKQLILFPAALSPITVFPNIPSLANATGDAEFTLTLRPRTLALIYNGDITHWNDPLIVETNPLLQSVDQEIKVVVRSETSGTTLLFQTAMSNFLQPEEWPWGVSDSWPLALRQKIGSRLILAPQGGSGPLASVMTTPFSLGYAADILLHQNGAGDELFKLYYDSTGPITVDDGLQVTANNVSFNLQTNLLNPYTPQDGCWPIFGVSYILFNINYTGYTLEQCKPYGEAARFFIWLLTTPAASRSAQDLDFASVQGLFNTSLIDSLLSMKCAGQPLIGFDFIDQRTEAVWDAMLVLGMVMAVIPVLIFLGTLITKEGVNRLGYTFTLSTLTGALLLLMAVILFYLVPSNDSICILRTWFVGIGNVLLIVPVATQVFFLTLTVYRSKSAKQSQLSFLQIITPILVFLALQSIILICWVAIDPYSSTVVVINEYQRTAYYICSSDSNWVWFGLEIAFFALLLLLAFLLNWYARNTSLTKLHYVTWMGFTVYNLLMFLIILVPILAGFNPPEPLQYFVITMGLIYPAIFTCLSLYGPIFLPNLFRGLPGIANLRDISKDSSAKSGEP